MMISPNKSTCGLLECYSCDSFLIEYPCIDVVRSTHQKSRHPHVSEGMTPFHWDSDCQMVCKWNMQKFRPSWLSTYIHTMCTSGSESDHRCWPSVTILTQKIENLEKLTSWNEVLWSLLVPMIIPTDPSWLNKSPYMSWCISNNILFVNGLLRNFSCSHAKRVLRTPISLCKRQCPKWSKLGLQTWIAQAPQIRSWSDS